MMTKCLLLVIILCFVQFVYIFAQHDDRSRGVIILTMAGKFQAFTKSVHSHILQGKLHLNTLDGVVLVLKRHQVCSI